MPLCAIRAEVPAQHEHGRQGSALLAARHIRHSKRRPWRVRLLVATRKHLAVGAAGSSIQHFIWATFGASGATQLGPLWDGFVRRGSGSVLQDLLLCSTVATQKKTPAPCYICLGKGRSSRSCVCLAPPAPRYRALQGRSRSRRANRPFFIISISCLQ